MSRANATQQIPSLAGEPGSVLSLLSSKLLPRLNITSRRQSARSSMSNSPLPLSPPYIYIYIHIHALLCRALSRDVNLYATVQLDAQRAQQT